MSVSSKIKMDECLPRPNNAPPVSIRKSAFGRTNLFLASNTTLFKEVKCSASYTTRQATASLYHMHQGNKSLEKKECIVCWHCCHSFDGAGFKLPRSYDATEKMYHVYGWFCSANCCKAYILEHSTFDRGYQMNVFVRMLREIYDIHEAIVESPPRISLKMFGGPFDIETFRTQKNVCFVVHPPFISYSMLIEERLPIENIGEKSNTIQKGTVRGLRRPVVDSVCFQDDISIPSASTALYSEFLKQDAKEVEGVEEPPAKKSKVVTAPTVKKGLAKFIK